MNLLFLIISLLLCHLDIVSSAANLTISSWTVNCFRTGIYTVHAVFNLSASTDDTNYAVRNLIRGNFFYSVRGNEFLYNPTFSINSSFTIMIWLKPIQVQSRWVRIFGKGASASRNYGLWVKVVANATSMIQIQASTGESFSTSHHWVFPTLNAWTHIADTWNGTDITLLVNGTLVGTYSALPAALMSDYENLAIGWARNFDATVAPMPQVKCTMMEQ